jgi:fimbrial chaperone protein
MKKIFVTKLVLILVCMIPSFTFANFTVTPVELEINKDKKVSSITLENNNSEDKNFQLTVYKVSNQGEYTETKDLQITPMMFKVASGKSQLIRVALNSKALYSIVPKGYVLVVQELPHVIAKKGSHVDVITEFKIPVSIVE